MHCSPQLPLCQPDKGKGCSVCCGLLNLLDCSREALSSFLDGGASRAATVSTHDRFTLTHATRDSRTHTCPYQGFLAEGKPGCHIHPLSSGTEGRDRSLFAHKICSSFLCPAHTILTHEEKEAMVFHVNDWYLYSVAIADPESFSFMLDFIVSNYTHNMLAESTGMLLNAGLTTHAELFTSGSDELFNYSGSEYILAREKFCIRYNAERREPVLEGIRLAAAQSGLAR